LVGGLGDANAGALAAKAKELASTKHASFLFTLSPLFSIEPFVPFLGTSHSLNGRRALTISCRGVLLLL
jgi:hypothetical protein